MSFNTRDMERNTEWITEGDKPTPEKMLEFPGWCILVRPIQVTPVTKGGIILTAKTVDDTQYLSTIGEVITLGNTAYKKEDEPWCKVGDYVLYQRFSGQKILWGGIKFLILNDDEVIAKTENPEYLDPSFNLSTHVE